MSIIDPPTPTKMTFEEFMALPDDGVHRELIRGEVRVICRETWDDPTAPVIPVATERKSMTVRNRFHCRVEAKFAMHLGIWLESLPEPRGEILSGECGFHLRGPDDTTVGIDVAYASAEQVAATDPKQKIFVGPPILAVEILSPSDTYETLIARIDLYHEFNVVLWVADPPPSHRGRPPAGPAARVVQRLTGTRRRPVPSGVPRGSDAAVRVRCAWNADR